MKPLLLPRIRRAQQVSVWRGEESRVALMCSKVRAAWVLGPVDLPRADVLHNRQWPE